MPITIRISSPVVCANHGTGKIPRPHHAKVEPPVDLGREPGVETLVRA